jgi:hypothetical protein
MKIMAGAADIFEKHKADIANKEIHRYAVPKLDNANWVQHSREQEIRNFYRGMDDKDPGKRELMDRLHSGSDSELLLAIMRSPVRMGNMEKLAMTGWRTSIDRRDPDGAERLQLDKAANDWAEGYLGMARVRLVQKLGYSRSQLFAKAHALKAAPFFGFSPAEILRFDRTLNPRREI